MLRLEADDGLSVGGVGVVFAERRGAVRDDAGRLPFQELPVQFHVAAGGDAGLELLDKWGEADLLEGAYVTSVCIYVRCAWKIMIQWSRGGKTNLAKLT